MPAIYPDVVAGEQYAKNIVAGKEIACKWIYLAAKRHLDDKKKQRLKSYPFRFDRAAAQRICSFARLMPHVKGKWAREKKTIDLEPWQCFILICLFGWVEKATGLRRFRQALLLIPRKNAKSTIAAVIGLYLFVEDGEHGAEVFSGATSENQAMMVFRAARLMAIKADGFLERYGLEVNVKSLFDPETAGFFKTLIGKPGDGDSPSCAIHDEYHEHDTDEQVDTMATGMGAREQPLQLFITTAGDNLSGPCYELCHESKKILEGTIENERFFFIYYTIDEGDDWKSTEALKKANPNYGVSVTPEYLEYQLQQARNNPRFQARFKTKNLNQWVGAMDAYFSIQHHNKNKRDIRLEDYKGHKIVCALDLASKIDLAALSILIELDAGEIAYFGKYYVPETTVFEDPKNEHYRGWVQDGILTATSGNITDYDYIKDDLEQLKSDFQIQVVLYDPFQATYFSTKMGELGFPMMEYGQTVLNLSEPMKELDANIRDHKLIHDGDPIFTWALSNVVAKEDKKDNVFPNKAAKNSRIDPAVSAIMARAGILFDLSADSQSAWETQDLIIG